MTTVMKASEFVEKLKDVVTNYKTLYIMGCFGAPMTSKNKKRYSNNHTYNIQPSRTQMIQAASADTFGFDCVCLIKGILWGWSGDTEKTYGGAKYKSNGVPDIGANGIITECTNISTDFSKIEVGELLWRQDHVGIYIGNGLAVESTPAWKNKVQITAVKNIGTVSGYPARVWTKHGKLPYIEYDVAKAPAVKPIKVDTAQYKNRNLAGQYKVNTKSGLHIRTGANSSKKSLGVLPQGTIVTNYGFYSLSSKNVKWLYVKTSDGTLGFCSSAYLKKI